MDCPACKGNIPEGANFCPYCGKVVAKGKFNKWWFWASLSGALVGSGLILAYQLFKERRLWDEQGQKPLSSSFESEESMNF